MGAIANYPESGCSIISLMEIEKCHIIGVCGTQEKMWHEGRNMNELSKSVEVHLGRQGRLVIPVALRRSLGFEQGDTLVAREEAGRLVLEKQETIKQRLKARFASVPRDRSLVDELIAERREEAKKEVAE
jgi:bifunctional DNA-binding transcriptional regulator/antitoxin component of YhaV-PrlF toxin-antitoxin module